MKKCAKYKRQFDHWDEGDEKTLKNVLNFSHISLKKM